MNAPAHECTTNFRGYFVSEPPTGIQGRNLTRHSSESALVDNIIVMLYTIDLYA